MPNLDNNTLGDLRACEILRSICATADSPR